MVIITMLFIFAIYNSLIYTQGTSNSSPKLSAQAIAGEQLWQDNNCTACHQIYGLGGYLGPDLTNVISLRGPDFVDAFVNTGVKSMPKFNFDQAERAALIEFLKAVDTTGFYPDFNVKTDPTGWINLKYKNR